jgi:exopolysaccharide biosynthesis WecB/TagA/CpsF family protein
MGLRLDKISAAEILRRCIDRRPIGMLVTPNTHFFVAADANPNLSQLFNSADISVCDSRVIHRLLFLTSLRVPLVTGSDLTNTILSNPAARDLRICIIGGRSGYGVAISEKFGLTHMTHFEFPYQRQFYDEELAEICKSIPGSFDLCFVCLGAPLQERVANILRREYSDRFPSILCVGGSIDFLVGAQSRSPLLLQYMGLEWLFRLASDPKRLYKRYLLQNPRIAVIFTRWLVSRVGRRRAGI